MNIRKIRSATHQMPAGFSLIEIMAVLFIIGMILALVGPRVQNAWSTGKLTTTKSNLKSISQALDLYYMSIGHYPQQLQDLVEKPKGADAKNWTERFMESIPTDGWGNEFNYKKTPKDKNPYELYSYGPHGPDADSAEYISVWNDSKKDK